MIEAIERRIVLWFEDDKGVGHWRMSEYRMARFLPITEVAADDCVQTSCLVAL